MLNDHNGHLNIVETRGVFRRELIREKKLKINPSSEIAYSTRGNGNIEPFRFYRFKRFAKNCIHIHRFIPIDYQ